ncbi:activating signal cointegrator 1 complex subunit 2 [Leptinotarsa decemlineata]|uniref:activating signal cointegrator 1 complex subunit 2 n=1 Tax=Leptinotarsa decemlineata TaxID=7539 RepID=UPI003D30563B
MVTIRDSLLDLNLNDNEKLGYVYLDVFKNPHKLPINEIHLERTWFDLKKNCPNNNEFLEARPEEIRRKLLEKKTEIIPALDKRWLPKCILYKFEPYVFNLSEDENMAFITKNLLFIESLEFLLECDFHQFWCTILFETSAAVSLRSFILNPIPYYQSRYLKGEYAEIYKTVFNRFLHVYKRLLNFRASEVEYMPENYGYENLVQKKLLNLPVVNVLAFLYKFSDIDFVNTLTTIYFSNTSQLDFQIREVEELINHSLMVLEMIGGHVCGFAKDAVIVPISIKPRPALFDLSWIYSVVNYLLNTLALLNTLFEFYKPSIEMSLNKELPFRMPFIYISVYKELYELLDNREELMSQKELSDKVFDEINLGRSEFVDVYHMFISYCLDKTLECIGDPKQQEHLVETYLRLLTTALEDDYFICDYNMKYNVASQNEMFESCTTLDTTRTEFIVSCINKFSRQKKLQELSKLKKSTVESIFKDFKPPELEPEEEPVIPVPSHNTGSSKEKEIDIMIQDIMDMFPHLGDGFILKCLESYNYNSSDVINAILEENLPPHLYDIPFDSIRIPPEPEPEKPVLAYKGKKPGYDDAMELLNDKKDVQEFKSLLLEGVQYTNDYTYDDEYDDRYDDDVRIKVADNPLDEVLTLNPNREDLASDTSYSSDEEYDDSGKPISTNENGRAIGTQDPKSRMNFCEDPAVLRERREARYRARGHQPQNPQKKPGVVGKPKGQGQEKEVLKARDKKNTQKSSRANHSRKSGAQWKRTRGMIPS